MPFGDGKGPLWSNGKNIGVFGRGGRNYGRRFIHSFNNWRCRRLYYDSEFNEKELLTNEKEVLENNLKLINEKLEKL